MVSPMQHHLDPEIQRLQDEVAAMSRDLVDIERALKSRRTTLDLLKDQRLEETDPEGYQREIQRRKKARVKQSYITFQQRKLQIEDLLAEDEFMPNIKIAERLGISAARVSQIRQKIDAEKERKTKKT